MCDTTVTINYENPEQIERLARAYYATWHQHGIAEPSSGTVAIIFRQMQAALREFASPTVEPCGQQARWQGISMAEPRTFTCGLPKDHDGVTHKDEGAGADWTFSP